MKQLVPVIALLALLCGCVVARDNQHAPKFERASLTIHQRDGRRIPLEIEVATTREQQEYGLMFRRSLPSHYGMLFIFSADEYTHFWMKDTLIPLDMLFIDSGGTIVQIVRRAEPMNQQIIYSSTVPVRAVLELNGGAADKDRIEIGDRVTSTAFPATP